MAPKAATEPRAGTDRVNNALIRTCIGVAVVGWGASMLLTAIGALHYVTMIMAGATWLHTEDAWLEKVLLPLTSLGVQSSAYFVYLQLVPIGAICPFCMMSAAATTTLPLIELVVRSSGGAAASPEVLAVRVWPVTFVATMLTMLSVLWVLPLLPLPGK